MSSETETFVGSGEEVEAIETITIAPTHTTAIRATREREKKLAIHRIYRLINCSFEIIKIVNMHQNGGNREYRQLCLDKKNK
ncbi:hypothetical protein McpCs1_11590 [Methanocorpusculaceae archaeon Cs1]|uniref:Uncharacterized protein n=1 Tax=Methanorbis rubei TaxID=3028300 RepID=A0AAE4SCG9_9EURY|nr:hypothetical protein [Methanocorpusculaceae archaeon Cs1]